MPKPLVILLHGLARSAYSMRRLEKSLRGANYSVLNLDYPSTQHAIEELADKIEPTIREAAAFQNSLAFVTHSMGSLVSRMLMHKYPDLPWQQAVYIAPPSQGSQVARTMGSHKVTQSFFQWFYGPAGQQFVKEEVKKLPLPSCTFGIIAGIKSHSLTNPTSWLSRYGLFPEQKSDGTLSVDETQMKEMTDFIEVEADHTTIMNDPAVFRYVQHFLQHQCFPDAS